MKNNIITFLLLFVSLLLMPVAAMSAENAVPASTEVIVYKSASCGCCKAWIKHLRSEGFSVIGKDRRDMPQIKASFGIDRPLQSCHTAVVDGYIIEGHVPASDIKRLLKQKPDVLGLTAPGMPKKSPGMQRPGLPPEGYDVLSFDDKGKTELFQRY
jgi:hypothetical protein